jgi:hypothetical protein
VLDVKPVRKNSLRGFAAVRLPNGLIINDVVIGESNGRRWALLPSRAMIARDGALIRDGDKIRYAPVVEWGTRELQQQFSRRVVALVEADFPDVFDAGPRHE